MQSEMVNLANNTLTGEWKHATSRRQLIVICHGYQSSSKNPTIIAIANGLNKSGHDTFTFTFSENTGGFDVEHQVGDIKKVVEFFKDYEEIVLLAGSFAALTGAIAVRKLSQVKGLITLNGFFGTGSLGQEYRKTYIKFRFAALLAPKYRKIWRYLRRELRPKDIKLPVLVIHSQADRYVHIKQSRHFYAKLSGQKHFIELETADHAITSRADRRTIVSQIHSWLSEITFSPSNHSARKY